MRKMRIFQHNEYIGLDFLERKVDMFQMHEGAHAEGIPIDINFPEKKVRFEQPEIAASNAIRDELTAFSKSILNGKQPEVSGTEAIRALELAGQILDKIRKNNHLSE